MMSANNKIQKSSFSEAQAKDNNDQDNLVVREDKKLNHHKHKSDQLLKEMLEYVQPETNIVDFHEDSQIAKFYEGRSVFITGASGFVGKCLLEKILRSCPKVREVFILMRPKRGREVGERVEAILRSELFERLRNLPYGMRQLEKVQPIRGDITRSLFGLSHENMQLLASRVSILIHSAATVKFEEPLKTAVENNVVSVENLIEVSSRMTQLEALVHVSTAYSNCNRKEVDEMFYKAPIQADRLIELSRWMEEPVLEQISPQLLDSANRPNTYTYTKAVAESLILQQASKLLPNLPIAVVRPSIVAGIWRQPIRGWVDNFNGPTGVMLAMMSGALQAVQVCPNYCADIVPVDMVANLIICSAWQVHKQSQQQHCSFKNTTTRCLMDNNKHVVQRPLKINENIDVDHNGQRRTDDHCHHHHHRHHHDLLLPVTNSNDVVSTQLKPQQQQSHPIPIIKNQQQITIFNCVSGSLNPLAWRDFLQSILAPAKEYPINDAIRQPGILLVANSYLFQFYNILIHCTFAYFGDFILKMAGQKSKLVILHHRLMRMIKTLKPFTVNQWVFNCSNTTQLYENMLPIDKEIFNFDTRQIIWKDYLPRYYIASKIFVVKDDPSKLLRTKRRLMSVNICSKFAQLLIILLAYNYLIVGTSIESLIIELLGRLYNGWHLTSY